MQQVPSVITSITNACTLSTVPLTTRVLMGCISTIDVREFLSQK